MDKYVKIWDVPKGQRWAHYWNYYKIHTFVGIFVVLMVAMLIKDVVFKEKIDMVLTVSSVRSSTEEVSGELERVLGLYTEDFDGNGKRTTDVNQIVMSTDINADPQMVMAAQTRLIAQFQDKNAIIFLMDEEIYDYLRSEEDLFADLSQTVGGSVTPLLGRTKPGFTSKIPCLSGQCAAAKAA